jgi:hypothetical protein
MIPTVGIGALRRHPPDNLVRGTFFFDTPLLAAGNMKGISVVP